MAEDDPFPETYEDAIDAKDVVFRGGVNKKAQAEA